MPISCDNLLSALLLGTVSYSIFIYRRYKQQQTAFQRCMSLTDRFHTVGEMAASVTHEIRNPLTTIHGYLQMFAKKKEFLPYQGQMTLLLEELDRANLLIKEYLSLCKDHTADVKPTQLNSVIRSLFPLLQAQANTSCKEICLQLGNQPDILLDDKEIRQLILNLARNGLEAMERGKTLTIETSANAGKNEVTLAICDQGKGIPKQILDKLGKPFLTTKENGTGLGLAVCYRIAARHKAKIKVETSGNGTTFYVNFPLYTNKLRA